MIYVSHLQENAAESKARFLGWTVSRALTGTTRFVWASAQELSLLPINVTCAADCRLTESLLVFTLLGVSAVMIF